METQKIWDSFNEELYFFILKKVKNGNAANDIFQDTFLKIHENLPRLKEEEKVKAWIYQIARNEVINFFNRKNIYTEQIELNDNISLQENLNVCCFDKNIKDLPEKYRQVIELVYIKGLKQTDVAIKLGISLENVKIRIRRAKDILKKNFEECCKFQINEEGKLIGESNCIICEK